MPSTVTLPERRFTVGDPEVVASRERLKEKGIDGIDASVFAVNDGGRLKWFCTSRWRHVHSVGPRSDPFERVIDTSGEFAGLPDAYADTKLGFSHDHLWGNISWIANVYRSPANGHILAFAHVEYAPRGGGGVYFRLGLAISKDGGRSFSWCGSIIEPELSYETWSHHWRPERFHSGFIYPNVGLANYVVRDGFFYLYYTDTRDLPDEFVNGAAVARAAVKDVLAAAEDLDTAPWHKYHEGSWREKGMGGSFTALGIEPVGFLHGDAAYNSYLGESVLVTRKYLYADGEGKVFASDWRHAKTGAVLISFSKDGIAWSDWRVVHEDRHAHDYPSIVSTGDDNEVTGRSFWVYYERFHETVLPDISWRDHRWERALVTLE
jgi:hypothetical protein